MAIAIRCSSFGSVDDGVQAESATTRHPLRPVLVLEQSLHRRPALTRVVRPEERGRLHAAPHDVGLLGAARRDLPHLREREPRALGEADRLALRPGPRRAEVVAEPDRASPVIAVRADERARASRALSRSAMEYTGLAGKVGTVHLPFLARLVGRHDERALRGADEDEHVAGRIAGSGGLAGHGRWREGGRAKRASRAPATQ